MSEIINYTRLTTSDKLSDRFLTCQVYSPVDLEQAESGTLFSQIEILNPWFPTSQIGQTVINTLIREYYRGTDTSDLVNFENAIKKVNEALAQIAQNGETDWIGKFNGCFILVNGNEAHFAQTGTSHAYLFRGSKLNHITEGLDPSDAPHPLKTFSNLTSGTLQDEDKIVIANSSFFELIAPSELRTIVTSFRPTIAAVETAKILKSHNIKSANAIFMELTNKESLANVPPDQKLETVYIDHQSSFDIGRSLRNFFNRFLLPAGKSFGRGSIKLIKKTHKYLSPKLASGFKVTKIYTSKLAERTYKGGKELSEKITKRSSKVESGSIEISDYKSAELHNSSKTTLLKTKNRVRRFLIRTGFYSKYKSKMILTILIAFLVILVGTVSIGLARRSSANSDQALKNKVAEISSLQDSASLKLVKKDESGALSDYKSIISLQSELKNTKYEAETAPIASKAQAKINTIAKLTSVSPSKTIDTGTVALDIALTDSGILEILKNGSVIKQNDSDSIQNPAGKISLPSNEITTSTSLADSKTIVLQFSNQKIATINFSGLNFTAQPVVLGSLGIFANFSDTVYLLDQLKNQIYKIPPVNNKYQTASTYIKDKAPDISDSVDLAIDGNVYVLSSNGQITKFSKGNKISTASLKLPASEKLSSYARLFTSQTSSYLFAVSSDSTEARIIEAKKDGSFVSQYGLDSSAGFSKIVLDPDSRKAYAVVGHKILTYKF